jgi:hypothetical protein
MIIVLCAETDVSALWAAAALQQRGLSPMVLTDSTLAAMRGWRHTIGADGARISLQLPDGRALEGGDVTGVFNRLTFLPRAWTQTVSGPDRDYALQEMLAFYVSWLHVLRAPKLNPPTPQGLCGNMRHASAWTALAIRASLPVLPFRQSCSDDPAAAWHRPARAGTQTVFVVGDTVVGPAQIVGVHQESCLRLAKSAGSPLLGIDFAEDADDGWRMTTASVVPELMSGGEALADVLAAALVR